MDAASKRTDEQVADRWDVSIPDEQVADLELWYVIPETLRTVQEGVFYADRDDLRGELGLDIRHGLFFTKGADKVLSLAYGTDLHGWKEMDYELTVFVE